MQNIYLVMYYKCVSINTEIGSKLCSTKIELYSFKNITRCLTFGAGLGWQSSRNRVIAGAEMVSVIYKINSILSFLYKVSNL